MTLSCLLGNTGSIPVCPVNPKWKGTVKWKNRCVFGSRKLCGFRPTGRLHLGHYFSVILPGQQDDVDVLIADYHAPMESKVEQSIKVLQKFGVKNIVKQAEVFNPELFFRLMAIAPIGELGRMTQFKLADPKDQTAHLMMYPVLMVHDVVNYSEVIVGEDQRQHLQFARLLLKKYNRIFGQDLGIPKENVVVGRIKDLKDPQAKMSKSNPGGCLFLDDNPDEIRQKLKRATADKDGLENLHYLYRFFVGGEPPESNFTTKMDLAEAIITKFGLKDT